MCLSSCLKCSVSCGTGIQVRKIECISGPSNSNGGGGGALAVGSGGPSAGIGMDVGSNGNGDTNDSRGSGTSNSGGGAVAAALAGGGSGGGVGGSGAAAAVTECNLNTKPTETQQCTTGIVCSNSDDETEDGSDEHYDNEHISSEVLLNIYTIFMQYTVYI